MMILIWLIVGGVAGWLASLVVRGGGFGVIGDIVIGIVGALIGGVVFSALGGQGFTGFNLWSFFVAFVGAVILLVIVRVVQGYTPLGGSRNTPLP